MQEHRMESSTTEWFLALWSQLHYPSFNFWLQLASGRLQLVDRWDPFASTWSASLSSAVAARGSRAARRDPPVWWKKSVALQLLHHGGLALLHLNRLEVILNRRRQVW